MIVPLYCLPGHQYSVTYWYRYDEFTQSPDPWLLEFLNIINSIW